jgi:uncharacterized protein (DUF1778 family)
VTTRAKPAPKPPKGFILQVRLSDEHKRAFEQAAALEGNNLSAFARSAMAARCRELGVKIYPGGLK